MCGIVAVVQRRARREPPNVRALVDSLSEQTLADVDAALRGTPGVRALLADPAAADDLDRKLAAIEDEIARREAAADDGTLGLTGAELEAFNASLVALKDATWAVRRDRLRTAREGGNHLGGERSPSQLRRARRRRAVRGRRPERRRRQLPRPARGGGPAHPGRGHHRCEGHPRLGEPTDGPRGERG